MRIRADRAAEDSDLALFMEVLYWGELLVKVVGAEVLAGIQDDRDRNRYALEYRLLRADGIGEWVSVLDEALKGPASQHLCSEVRTTQRAVTQQFPQGSSEWQRTALDNLADACKYLDVNTSSLSGRAALMDWFATFVAIRNRTRGHGAARPDILASAIPSLRRSVELLSDNLPTFGRDWAHLKRNLSGKYRVSLIAGDRNVYSSFAMETDHKLPDGVYVHLGRPRRSELILSDADLSDFFLPNGNYRHGRYETLSYLTDERRTEDGSRWLLPVDALPASETTAAPDMELVGETFSNIPPRIESYVPRPSLESELRALLDDSRHPVITLLGRGGVGKTSLALEVLHAVAKADAFFSIVWFSARDIDLLPDGPKVVRADVLSRDDVAREFSSLMRPGRDWSKKEASEYFSACLSGEADDGPFLFVFDNFETLRDPDELYASVSNSVRLPNKVLITTRTRDFKADYPVEVRGMSRSEHAALVDESGLRLGVLHLLNEEYRERLYDASNGHPYVTKILLGEVANAGQRISFERVIASQDSMLDALFERSFAALSPAAQRVFLTLCSWRSLVPRVGLQAALLRPGNDYFDLGPALDELLRSSLIEELRDDEGGAEFLSVPLAAALFGKQKLVISPMQTAIEADLELIRGFGVTKSVDASKGLGPQVDRLARVIARSVAGDDKRLTEGVAVLEYIAHEYPPAWLRLADLQIEFGKLVEAVASLERYTAVNAEDREGWSRLAEARQAASDPLGEIHARLRLAELDSAPFQDVTKAAARLTSVLSTRELDIDKDVRHRMVDRLRRTFERRASEADATDLSRLAWLCLHLQDLAGAKAWAERGLALHPTNDHCRKIIDRITV